MRILPLLLGLAACAAPNPLLPKADENAVDRYRLSGYDSGAAQSIEYRHFSSPPSMESGWSAELVRPSYGGHMEGLQSSGLQASGLQSSQSNSNANPGGSIPVIIYIPALGRGDDAPNRWCDAWARRGYAVFRIQPLAGDAGAWQTPAAIDGDFESVAHSRYAASRMPHRIARLQTVLQALRARSLRRDADLDDLDWSRLALAGSGLGAYTVQRIAATHALASFPVRAYLAISPYPGPGTGPGTDSGTGPGTGPNRPQKPSRGVRAPILMISSQDDIDPDGVIADPLTRHRAFDRIHSVGTDYYLEFLSASHSWLDGAPEARSLQPDTPDPELVAGIDNPTAEGWDNKPNPATERKLRRKHEAAHRKAVQAQSRRMTDTAIAAVSFDDVSTAFLDANLRGRIAARIAARNWLAQRAAGWLRQARLKRREDGGASHDHSEAFRPAIAH